MVILEFDFKSLNDKIVNSASSPSKEQKENVRCRFSDSSHFFERILERDSTSLYKYTRSNRRRSSGREGKTFYAEQVTRGPRVCEFLTNSKR